MDSKRGRKAGAMKHKGIQTNKGSLADKDKAWEAITSTYNACQRSGLRDKGALKSLYENMKRTGKKNLSQDRVIIITDYLLLFFFM